MPTNPFLLLLFRLVSTNTHVTCCSLRGCFLLVNCPLQSWVELQSSSKFHRGGKPPKMDGLLWKKTIKMDDLGIPLFLETPICMGYVYGICCFHWTSAKIGSPNVFHGYPARLNGLQRISDYTQIHVFVW